MAPCRPGTPTDALKATLDNDKTFILLSKYKWNQFTVYGGWEHDYFTNPSDTSFPCRLHHDRRTARPFQRHNCN